MSPSPRPTSRTSASPHKRAIAFAEQLNSVEAYRPELRFADGVKGLHLYGAKIIYPDEIVLLNLTKKTTTTGSN